MAEISKKNEVIPSDEEGRKIGATNKNDDNNKTTTIAPDLHGLIKVGEWAAVRDWYEAHPEQIRDHVDPSNGSTVLHEICFISSVPIGLLEFVLDAWPEAVTVQENRFGATPLHLLCWTSQRSVQKVQLLLDRMAPEDLMIRNRVAGSTVLHSACGSCADLSVIEAIVRKHPPILLAKTLDQHQTAISALWFSHTYTIPGHMQIARILKGEVVNEFHFTRFWNKIVYLAKERFRISSVCPKHINRDDNDDEFLSRYILHGMLDLKSPLHTIQVALKVNPDWARYADTEGNYPLHHAVIRRPYRIKDVDLIRELLQIYPEAAGKRNSDGDAPIHIAIRDRMVWEEGLGDIVKADASDVLGVLDRETGLYPFLMGAALGGKSAVNTTFSLMIARPDLVRGAS